MMPSSAIIGERRRPKRSEREIDGVVPSHASLTILKHAVNAIRKVTSSSRPDRPKPTHTVASTSAAVDDEDVVENWESASSSDASTDASTST